MDYGELLYKAQQNERNSTKQDVRCYKSGFAPPKKLERTVSTANVKKFLARKETEEKHKQLEAQKKREDLLALRSQDKKAKRRVEFMLKRTKSANYSVMEDAIDNNNTADTLEGPMQCDEDDYGYVSQEASAFYAKLMNKYTNMPAEPSPFSKTKREVKDLSAAKDRVRAALKKEEEEAELPHKRKRKHKDGDTEDGKEEETSNKDIDEKGGKSKSKDKNEKSQEPVKKKQNNAPPPPSFQQLLKLAEEKKSKPVDIEEFIRNNAPKEPDRPMTQKEKIEWQREQERKMNRERREKGLPSLPSRFEDSSKSRDKVPKTKIPKIEGSSTKNSEVKDRSTEVTKKVNGDVVKKVEPPKPALVDKTKSSSSSSSSTSSKKYDEKNRISVEKKVVKFEEPDDEDALGDIERQIELLKKKKMMLAQKKAQAQAASKQPKPSQLSEKPKSYSAPIKSSQSKLPVEKSRIAEPPKQKVPLPAQQKPPVPQVKQKSSGGPPRGPPKPAGASQVLRPSYLPPTKPKDKHNKKPKRRIDSESEYDSELDDFIEDEDDGEADYSSYIKEIFGYDKSRYRNVDDDDECMESNFAQQMKEEFVSTKIGIMEDLEDIKKEQEEKKRLKAKKMMKSKTARGK